MILIQDRFFSLSKEPAGEGAIVVINAEIDVK